MPSKDLDVKEIDRTPTETAETIETTALNREEDSREINGEVHLSKKDVSRAFWHWQFFSHANYNYERMQGTSFAASLSIVLEKLYQNKDDLRAALKRHLTFFNTDPNFGSVIHGLTIAMEEEKRNGADIDDDAINSIKTGLMGPLAGIGDTMVQGIIIPLVVAIGIDFGINGNIFGPLLVMIGLPVILISIARFFWMQGYNQGNSAITNILSGGKMQKILGAAGILGCTVLGGLISNYVRVSTTIAFNIGDSAFDLQTMLFDKLLPGLLPFAATLCIYTVLRKTKLKSVQILLILIVIAFVGSMIGIF